MRNDPSESETHARSVAATLRAVRKHRRMRQVEVASALGISRRLYLDLESGTARLTFEQLIAFADATRSDRLGFVAAVLAGKPSLAVRSADNKVMSVMAIAADDFSDAVGDRMAALPPQELMSALQDVFARLALDLERRAAQDGRLLGRLGPSRSDPTDD